MYEAPPPYPGIDPNLSSYNVGAQGYGAAAAASHAPPFTNGYPSQGCSAAGIVDFCIVFFFKVESIIHSVFQMLKACGWRLVGRPVWKPAN